MASTRDGGTTAAAGISADIANSIALTQIAGAALWPLVFSVGREFWSSSLAMALIPIFAKMSGAAARAADFVVLNALAPLSAKLIFGAVAPRGMVLLFNGIYAVVAIGVYVFGRQKGRVTA